MYVEKMSSNPATFIECDRNDATHVVKAIERKKLGDGYSTQCPHCGHTESGFDTMEQAMAWNCPECNVPLPFDQNCESHASR